MPGSNLLFSDTRGGMATAFFAWPCLPPGVHMATKTWSMPPRIAFTTRVPSVAIAVKGLDGAPLPGRVHLPLNQSITRRCRSVCKRVRFVPGTERSWFLRIPPVVHSRPCRVGQCFGAPSRSRRSCGPARQRFLSWPRSGQPTAAIRMVTSSRSSPPTCFGREDRRRPGAGRRGGVFR